MWGNQSRKTHHNNYQQRGFQNSNGNYHRNADIGPSQVKPPFQKPNLYDHTAKNSNNKLEEATAKLIDLSIASIAKQKNIDTFIKNLELQVGQLEKQLQNSSNGFSATTKQNPKGHCVKPFKGSPF